MHLNGKWNVRSLSLLFIPNQLSDSQWIAIKLTSSCDCRKTNARLFIITETRTDTRCACNIVTAVSVPSFNTLRRFKQYWMEWYSSEMLCDTISSELDTSRIQHHIKIKARHPSFFWIHVMVAKLQFARHFVLFLPMYDIHVNVFRFIPNVRIHWYEIHGIFVSTTVYMSAYFAIFIVFVPHILHANFKWDTFCLCDTISSFVCEVPWCMRSITCRTRAQGIYISSSTPQYVSYSLTVSSTAIVFHAHFSHGLHCSCASFQAHEKLLSHCRAKLKLHFQLFEVLWTIAF